VRRRLEPELLDELPPEDPRAIRSRRDLQRINWFMGNARLLAALLLAELPDQPRSIVELGSGDGTLMLDLARRLVPRWSGPVRLQLLDRQPVVRPATLQSFASLGWHAEVLQCDLRDWVSRDQDKPCDLILANLFLLHFSEDELRSHFAAFARLAPAFASCDPRRWRPALVTTRLLWAIGCNRVTRHDAIASVRAGFRHSELSALWPAASGFTLREIPASYASHIFLARKTPQPPA
jgi:hypothetical protein